MALRKRGQNWWIDIRLPNGTRLRRSTGTASKKAAQEYHDRLKAELWRQHRLGDKPRRTWPEAMVRWARDKAHKKDLPRDLDKARWLDPYLGDRYLDEINEDLIDEIIEAKADEGVDDSTINRYLALIRAVLRRAAFMWKWLEHIPAIELRPEGNGRNRWLTRDEAARLLAMLPVHYALPARFALATGLRQSNVLRLRWDQIDLTRSVAWIHADQAKAGRAIPVPLNADAMAVLQACQGQHAERVFTKDGIPFRGIDSRVWKQTLQAAGIEDFRWHDLRHTWASWHVMAGTPLREIMELGGWLTYRMVLRYAHLSADHLQGAAQRIEGVSPPPAPPRPPRSERPQLRLVK